MTRVVFPDGTEENFTLPISFKDKRFNGIKGWVKVGERYHYVLDNNNIAYESYHYLNKFLIDFMPNYNLYSKEEVERLLKLKIFI